MQKLSFRLLSVLLLGTVVWGRHLLDGAQTATSSHVWYIAAEEVSWDYLPGGKNQCKRPESQLATKKGEEGEQHHEAQEHALWTTAGLGSVLKKAAYVQYSDDSFQVCRVNARDARSLLCLLMLGAWAPGTKLCAEPLIACFLLAGFQLVDSCCLAGAAGRGAQAR